METLDLFQDFQAADGNADDAAEQALSETALEEKLLGKGLRGIFSQSRAHPRNPPSRPFPSPFRTSLPLILHLKGTLGSVL